mgnify:CR=1 FL=1
MSEAVTMQRYKCHKEVSALKIAKIEQSSADKENTCGGTWELIPENENNGYFVAKKVEALAFANEIPRIKWSIHSQNPVGRKNIEMAMKNADKYWSQNEKDGS